MNKDLSIALKITRWICFIGFIVSLMIFDYQNDIKEMNLAQLLFFAILHFISLTGIVLGAIKFVGFIDKEKEQEKKKGK